MASVESLRELEQKEFDRWYQEKCDTDYWSHGQCCAGCDFWNSRAGNSGECHAAGLVAAEEVLSSVGITSWTGPKEPGFPLTRGDFWCGKFQDYFDWSALPNNYLLRIGAKVSGALRQKPTHKREPSTDAD